MVFEPPYLPDAPTNRTGMAYDTVVRRWPIIIAGAVDRLHKACHALSLESQQSLAAPQAKAVRDKLVEGKSIIEKMSKLKYHMGRDHLLEQISADGEPFADEYNIHLKHLTEIGRGTWFTAPWMFAECYLYCLLRSFFASTIHWRTYDPFLDLKMSTFSQSGKSILKIATSMHELGEMPPPDADKIAILFGEMIQICLWGNATDLSLLTHLSIEDMEHLQTVGKDAREARKDFILRDDQEQLWLHVKSITGGRLDFVLDNAGFELFTDFVLADFLVTCTPHFSRVVFHPKLIPWFVSDVTVPDFNKALSSLSDPSFFPHLASSDDQEARASLDHLTQLVGRWKRYINEGIFSLAVPLDTPLGGNDGSALAEFWTSPWPYWEMETRAAELFKRLKASDLVIFKGDLKYNNISAFISNSPSLLSYRKLTGDLLWPAWTPLTAALGPLAGAFPLLSLRTNKATVVVGIDKEVAEKLDDTDVKWRCDGRYALISFLDASRS